MLGAQEKHRGGNLLRLTHAPERDGTADFFSALGIFQGTSAHIGVNPAGSDAVDVNAVRRQFR